MKLVPIGINPPRLPLALDVYVVPNGAFWSTRFERDRFNHATFETQAEAIVMGMQQAREACSMLIVLGRDGSVRQTRDYREYEEPTA